MKIHEYQAKELFKAVGMPVLRGVVATSVSQTVDAAKSLGAAPWVVKAQVHAGGRGKAGGVKLCKTLQEVEEIALKLLGKNLVTYQSGPEGSPVNTLLVEEGCQIASELYLAAVMDRATSSIVVMASREGGMDIEEVAAKTPEKIFKVQVDPYNAKVGYQARTLAYALGLPAEMHKAFSKLVSDMAKLFMEKDCSLLEINPLVITKDNQFIVLDGKVDFDGNALYRHEELLKYRDITQENPRDVEASKWNLNYIHLDGNIACMVNGAGLAMSTMDVIKMAGGEPANFLDVGGGANTEMVKEAFKILVSDPNVKGIFVNIFGGIMKVDVLANGIVQAVQQVGLKVPLVARLEGTNVEEGRRILKESGLNIQTASNMADAAKLIVAAVKG